MERESEFIGNPIYNEIYNDFFESANFLTEFDQAFNLQRSFDNGNATE